MSDLINRIYGDFDKKNEVPKVKIPKFATGGICNDAIFPKLDAFSHIDEIVKDIRDRQDNVIAMEFTKCIGELLKKNCVVPKITEYTHENVKENSIEHLYGVTIDELDFSEHDKVFEDKITDLQQRIRELIKEKDEYKRKCNDFGFENQDLKKITKGYEDKIAKLEKQIDRLNEEKSFLRTRCMPYVEKDFDNRLYGKLAIVSCNEEFVDIGKYADGDDLYSREVRNLISEGGIKRLIGQYRNLSSRLDKMSDENKGLKQRIAELESKEDEKPTKYITVIVAKEINGQEYVRLEDFMSVVNDLQAEIGT